MSTEPSDHRPIVFVHVGAPKTGTTFVQEVLWAHRHTLAEEGILLPGARADHYRATLDVREVRANHASDAVGSWQKLVDEALTWGDRVVITHELLAGATAEQARRAVESLHPAEVHIVYTARDFARQIPAEWQEGVKHRRVDGLDEYVDKIIDHDPGARWFWRVQDPADVLRRWGSTLPMSQVHVLTVPPANTEPGLLWQRFASLIGIDPAQYDTTVARANVSLGLQEAELLRRVNVSLAGRLSEPGVYPKLVKETLAHRILAERAGKLRFGLSPSRRSWLEDQSQHMIDELAKMECDVVGDLDELLPPDTTASAVYPDDVEADAVADAAADTIAELLVMLRKRTVRAEKAEKAEKAERAERAEQSVRHPSPGTEQRRPRYVQTLVDVSERRRSVMRARVAYRKAVDALAGMRVRRARSRGSRS